LGFCANEYLPHKRGFDNFVGFYSAGEDYFTRKKGYRLNWYVIKDNKFLGRDYNFFYNDEVYRQGERKYSTVKSNS